MHALTVKSFWTVIMMDNDCVKTRSAEALGGDERLETFARPLAVILCGGHF